MSCESKRENLAEENKYLGVSKSSSSDTLIPHSKLDTTSFLYRMIEKKGSIFLYV